MQRTANLALFWLLSAILRPCSTYALVPSVPLKAYLHRTWDTPSWVSVIAQTSDGFVWAGLPDGIARFDGDRFRFYTPENTPELKGFPTTAMISDKKGAVWLGTHGGGVVRIDRAGAKGYSKHDGLASDAVQALFEDRHGDIWVGGDDGALSRISAERITTFEKSETHIARSVLAISEDAAGRLWIGTYDQIVVFADGGFKRLPDSDGALRTGVRFLFRDHAGTIWISTPSGLCKFNAGLLQASAFGRSIRKGIVHAMAEDRQGNLWLATEAGLCRSNNAALTCFGVKDGLSSPIVRGLLISAEGDLWVSTSAGGLERFRDRRYSIFSREHGLSSDGVWTTEEDLQGGMWVGTEGGLDRVCNGRIRSYTVKDGLPSDFIITLFTDSRGIVWIGTRTGLCHFDGSGRLKCTASGLLPVSVYAIAEAPDGSLLVGGAWKGVYRGNGKTFTKLLDVPPVRAITAGHDGSLWIGTTAGLFQYKYGSLVRFGADNEFCFTVREDADGKVWSVGFSGLARVSKGKVTHFPAALGGPFADGMANFMEGSTGYVWITAGSSVFRLRKRDLNDFADKRTSYVPFAAFEFEEGMPSLAFAASTENAGHVARDGRLWLPTNKGLFVFDPKLISINRSSPGVVIDDVLLDDQAVPLTRPAIAPAGAEHLEFRYAAIELMMPQTVQFRYKLEGFDRQWIPAGSRRSAYYTHLPHGSYRFRVSARNGSGIWSEPGDSFQFQISPHFYETWWFELLCAAAAILTTIAIYRLRMIEMRKRFAVAAEERFAERSRIAREIHDTLLQGLTGASLVLRAAAAKISDAEFCETLRLALQHIEHTVADTRDAIWNMRRQEHNNSDLAAVMQEYGTRVAADAGLQFRFSIKGIPVTPHPDVGHDLTRIGQEAILNAAKHSKATVVGVALTFEGDVIHIVVEDNGAGFDTRSEDSGAKHWGIIGMKERAAAIGADLKISSTPGCGTSVHVIARLNRGYANRMAGEN